MSTREDRVLTEVATAIGSTLGALAAKTGEFKRMVKTKERGAAKKVRRVVSRAAIAKRRKSAARGARRLLSSGKRSLRRAVGRRKR